MSLLGVACAKLLPLLIVIVVFILLLLIIMMLADRFVVGLSIKKHGKKLNMKFHGAQIKRY